MGNPDIWIPVGIGLLTFVLAYMGVHVTLYPPQADARIGWALGFLAVAVLCCCGIGWQAVRSVTAQEGLQAQLNRIQHNTETPPTVNVQPAPVTVVPSAPLSRNSRIGVGWNLNNGEPASPASVLIAAPHDGRISLCVFTDTASDPSTDLVIDIKLEGTTIFKKGSITIPHGLSAHSQMMFTDLLQHSVTAGSEWEMDITQGTASWKGALSCQ